MSTPHLYSLHIAIDKYPIKSHQLDGCINDQKAIKEYLESKFPKSRRHFKTLFDKAATRKKIIDSFAHFKKAKDGDVCVLSFSGHGSQSKVPKEFAHLESDGMSESIVCYDSRVSGGRDLMDKELSWLLWKATHKKNVHFLVIMDCCHSGSNVRSLDYKVRMAPSQHQPTTAKNYLGFKDYIKTKVKRKTAYLVPKSNLVHLAAAKSDELAKELSVDGKVRGIFSYSLLETLQQSNGQISYSQLINKVRLKIFNRVDAQSPQLEGKDQHQTFLGGAIQPVKYQVGYNGLISKWTLNAGSLHGITKGTRYDSTVVELENGKKLKVKKVLPASSELQDYDPDDYMKVFNAKILKMSVPKLKLAFTSDSIISKIKILKSAFGTNEKTVLEIPKSKRSAHYHIRADKNGFQCFKPGEKIPAFKTITGTKKSNAVDFWSRVMRVAKWVRLLELSNPASKIKASDFKIDVYKSTETGNYDDDAKVRKVSNLSKPLQLNYAKKGRKHYSPAIKVKITNMSHKNLWISALYFSNDKGITNILLPKHELPVKKSVWLRQLSDDVEYRVIPLELDDVYLKNGITKIEESLKFIISTEEFDTENYCQEGLPQEEMIKRTRKISNRSVSNFTTDWTTQEVTFLIEK